MSRLIDMTAHPKGQRVDDLVAFATEILQTYAPEKLQNG